VAYVVNERRKGEPHNGGPQTFTGRLSMNCSETTGRADISLTRIRPPALSACRSVQTVPRNRTSTDYMPFA
jgi:hypothetical protein